MEMRRSRVLVAAAGFALGMLCVWLRLGWIQIVQHEHYAERAEHSQEQRILLKPARGTILDRNAQPLARDLLSYSISAAPREMTDPRAVARRLAAILAQSRERMQRAFASRPRYLWVARNIAPAKAQDIMKIGTRGLYLALETQRDYPLSQAACELVGRTDPDNLGVEGLELQFDPILRGRPGWTTLILDGQGGQHQLPGALRQDAENGRSLVLTLDAELQLAAEAHLAAAVDSLHAQRGVALFLEPSTGAILAMASWPHARSGAARNLAVSDQYEPGSTFKLVVMAAALEDEIAKTTEVFNAENGTYRFGRGAVIRDAHPHGDLSLFDAFRVSSNIVMGKLALRVGKERLYRYATAMGFGSLTGIEFPGEVSGLLRPPERWSGRSLPTIAIGQEVTCTPMQIALAYAAVANGGVLMHPMLALEQRDARGHTIERYTPQAMQRIFSAHTAAVLRRMMEAVVDSGTATAARMPSLTVAGKTGTAQKYDPEARTYGRGKFLSSFVGFAPAEDPRILGLILIDEPHAHGYYGGEVAAPVFRHILEDARRMPDSPLGPRITTVAFRPPAPAPVTVPDLRLLPKRAAFDQLESLGLRGLVQGDGAHVVAQRPTAGSAVDRGAQVVLQLGASADSAARVLPDLRGLAARDALRMLSERLVPQHVEGSGIVVRQSPPPGAALPLDGACTIYCERVRISAGEAAVAAAGPR